MPRARPARARPACASWPRRDAAATPRGRPRSPCAHKGSGLRPPRARPPPAPSPGNGCADGDARACPLAPQLPVVRRVLAHWRGFSCPEPCPAAPSRDTAAVVEHQSEWFWLVSKRCPRQARAHCATMGMPVRATVPRRPPRSGALAGVFLSRALPGGAFEGHRRPRGASNRGVLAYFQQMPLTRSRLLRHTGRAR